MASRRGSRWLRSQAWALAGLVGAAGALSIEAQEAQDPPAPGSVAPAAQASAALTPEAREALELLRSVLAEEGPDSARVLLAEIVQGLVDPESGEETAHLAFVLELDRTAEKLGNLEECLRLRERVLHFLTLLRPPDHPALLAAKHNLGATRLALGDLAGAKELLEAALEVETRLLPPDHIDLLESKLSVGVIRYMLGDLAGAKELQEAAHEALTRLLPPDHPALLDAKHNLALTRSALGDLAGAKELLEAVLEARTRLAPPDDIGLLRSKAGVGGIRYEFGDLAGAKELQEAAHEALTRLLPPDHPTLLQVKNSLALTRQALGDLAGAKELQEAVLEVRTRLLPADHRDLVESKQVVGGIRLAFGDLAGAMELYENVLEVRTRLLPPEHPDLLRAKGNLAVTRHMLGDLAGAKELQEALHEAWTRLTPPDHHDLLSTKQNLAAMRYAVGDLAGANELLEAVLEIRSRLLPPDHPDLLGSKLSVGTVRKALGDLAGAKELVSSLLAGVQARAAGLRAEAARPAREVARDELGRLSAALSLCQSVDPEHTLDPELFATIESLRLASVASAEVAQALTADPELAREARGIAEARSKLNDVAAAGPEDTEAVEAWRAELLSLAEERDRAERSLRKKLAGAGAFVGEIDAKSVGARLASGTAAVSCLRYEKRFEKDATSGETPPSVDSLLAFVVLSGGAVKRVELGPAAELEVLVADWRRALGKPIERGIAQEEEGERSEEELGRALRARLLDPLLAAAGDDVHELHVVLDDVLFLVPLDALPLDEDERVGERVGERYRIRVEPTLARLLREERPVAGGTLVALGGIDFDAETTTVATANPAPLVAAATPPLERSGRPEAFELLRQTRYEIEDVGTQYREAFEAEPVLLGGADATKAALHGAAPKARFLHLATHGWFASESFKSQLDSLADESARDAFQRAEQTLAGFAPETLCGLALAGANRGKDSLGRVPGILTAEELSSFDLRGCELAVLSACETNVGIRRAGQGIQSLQSALHAAGARTAITSLWKVDDAATRRLFELFYTKLWKEKLGKSDALWQAKMALRAEGHPPRDWAGWVLSGDPE